MQRPLFLVICVVILFAGVPVCGQERVTATAATLTAASERALLDRYCVVCHSDKLKTGGLTLQKIDLTHVGENAETLEKVVRMLRSGMMPKAGMPRPDQATMEAAIGWLENELDRNAVSTVPPPGVHRLNRTEYQNAIRDLLALEIDPGAFLPSDDSTHGFDNQAGAAPWMCW